MSSLPRALLIEVCAAYHRAGALLELALEDAELASDYPLYSLLGHGRATPTELSRALGIAMSTTVSRINRLVERGHAERTRHPRDGRSSYVSLTDEGSRRLAATEDSWVSAIGAVRRHLPVSDQEATAVVAAVGAALEAAIEELRDEAYEERAA
jgi:DNA-binding MarR family transcriptional regulator